ncbi:ATP synthase subunit I [uncultured Megasphaera sp.]|uniref:ATP synthase subunit I n=1 Tax=uncultured Megasphaera sp. TaxID=165188 RepID=UPI0028683E10|nr:ATP synthase subunit I [uncultured Megasphaera sp.]
MEEFYTYVKATIFKLIGFTCIVTAILLLGGWWQYISGWCIGSGLNIIYFFMLSSRSVRALKLPPARAAAFIRGGAVFRLFFICLAVIVIAQFPSISLGAVLTGILSYRVLIFADALTARLKR